MRWPTHVAVEVATRAELKFGDICRADCTAPARYLGNGNCVWISCQDNCRQVSQVNVERPFYHPDYVASAVVVDDDELLEIQAEILGIAQ